jgi:type II secretory pathway pseudopilin PulG
VRAHGTAGFTYIGLLVLIAVTGLGLALAAELWQTAQKRAKEEELLFVGDQFRRAIGAYRATTAHYPDRLEDLIKDPGFPGVRRYLRRIYRDPVTGRAEWGLLKADGTAIAGVYSLSEAMPLKQGGFSLADRDFEGKQKYSEWVFIAKIAAAPPAGGAPQTQGTITVTGTPEARGAAGESGLEKPGSGALDSGAAALGRLGSRARR